MGAECSHKLSSKMEAEESVSAEEEEGHVMVGEWTSVSTALSQEFGGF